MADSPPVAPVIPVPPVVLDEVSSGNLSLITASGLSIVVKSTGYSNGNDARFVLFVPHKWVSTSLGDTPWKYADKTRSNAACLKSSFDTPSNVNSKEIWLSAVAGQN